MCVNKKFTVLAKNNSHNKQKYIQKNLENLYKLLLRFMLRHLAQQSVSTQTEEPTMQIFMLADEPSSSSSHNVSSSSLLPSLRENINTNAL